MKKLLVAYDGSDLSKKALEKAKKLVALTPETDVHVIAIVTNTGPSTNAAIAHSIQMELAENYQVELEKIKNSFKEEGILIKTEVIIDYYHWNAGDKIVKYAEDHQIDQIVLGSRGLGGVKKLLLGSVSNHVVHHAHCEILIVK